MPHDLPPGRPSFITRVLGFDSRRFGLGQARRARSPQIAQALGPRFSGCFVAQRRVWPDVVVIIAPQAQFSPSIAEAVEYLLIQAFVAQAAVEGEEGSENSPGDCLPRRKM